MNRFLFIMTMFLISHLIYSEEGYETYIKEANRLYIQGDFEGAFTEINHYFFVTEDGEVIDKAYILGEKIYYFYIRSLFTSEDFIGISYIEKSLVKNSRLNSDRVNKALDLLKDGDDVTVNIIKYIEPETAVDNVNLRTNSTKYSSEELTLMLKNSLLEGEKSAKQVTKVTVLLTLLIVFIFVSMISLAIYIVIKISSRRLKHKSGNNLSPALVGISDSTILEFDNLLKDCKKIGVSIDEATGRKNSAVNSAELVYKIARNMKYSEKESLLFFAVTLVHDIGLLGIDKSILQSDTITAEEFEEIKKHVEYGETSLSFIPDSYKNIFSEAVTKHHENLDGTGYPLGLISRDIPYIARVLRVVESYLSQISSRGYKVISDKETAIIHLKSEPEVYDLEIVECLDKVI